MPQEQLVSAYLCKSDNALLLNPSGTFKGYGGYVGIGPFISVSSQDRTPGRVGSIVVDLLAKSVATGYHIKDFAKYNDECLDKSSKDVSDRYFKAIKSSSDFSRLFQQVEVWRRKGNRKVRIYSPVYDKNKDCSSGTAEIKLSVDDRESIGQEILDRLRIERLE